MKSRRRHQSGFVRMRSFAVATALLVGCAGSDRPPQDTTGTGTPSAAPPAAAPSAPAPARAEDITAQMVALGDSIFEGKAAAGICFTCHGPEAKGTQLGPDLTDQQWLNGDGSYPFIVQTVTRGVATPKQFPGPMPPFGQSLTPAQVRAVAAYVYSLTHPTGGA